MEPTVINVEEHIGLVMYIAKSYSNTSLPIEDLRQEGYVGLVMARDTYDPDKGAFSTWAVYWIRKCILAAIYANRNVAIPVNVQMMRGRVVKFMEAFAAVYGYSPEEVLVAKELHITRQEVRDLLNVQFHEEYDVEAIDSNDATVDHVIFDAEVAHVAEVAKEKLTDKERIVLALRYGLVELLLD